MKHTFPLFILLIVACSLFGTMSADRGTRYLLEYDNESYIFIVTNIKHEKSDNLLIESIEYHLFQKGGANVEVLKSFIKYQSIKNGKHSYTLKKIEGTDEITIGKLSFTWSYGSEDHIYLYPKEGTKILKMKV